MSLLRSCSLMRSAVSSKRGRGAGRVRQALAQGSRIVLAAGKGLKSTEIAERVGVSRNTAAIWRERFAAHRLDGLTDEPRPGRPRISDEQVDAVFTTTLGARRRTPRTAPPGQLQVLQGPAVRRQAP